MTDENQTETTEENAPDVNTIPGDAKNENIKVIDGVEVDTTDIEPGETITTMQTYMKDVKVDFSDSELDLRNCILQLRNLEAEANASNSDFRGQIKAKKQVLFDMVNESRGTTKVKCFMELDQEAGLKRFFICGTREEVATEPMDLFDAGEGETDEMTEEERKAYSERVEQGATTQNETDQEQAEVDDLAVESEEDEAEREAQ